MTDEHDAPPPAPSPEIRFASLGLRIIAAAYAIRTVAMVVAAIHPALPGSFVIGSVSLLWAVALAWLAAHLAEPRQRRWAPAGLGLVAVALAAGATVCHIRPFGDAELRVTLWVSVALHLAAMSLCARASRTPA